MQAGATDWINEKKFQKDIMDYAAEHGWLVHHCYSSKYCSGAGFPDLVMVRDGEILLVELKSETGRTSRKQMDWLQAYPHMKIWRPSMWDKIKVILD